MRNKASIGIALVGGALLVAALVIVVVLGSQAFEKVSEPAPTPQNTLNEDVQPVPLPKERPMVGGSGTDVWGYPHQTADQLGLQQLLFHRKFDALTRYIEAYQDDFELDFRKEYWPVHALDAFNVPNTSMEPLIEAWIKHSPDSWAPYAARGRFRLAMGWFIRGSGAASDTSVPRMDEMRKYHVDAYNDAKVSLEKCPKLQASHRTLLQASMTTGMGSIKEIMGTALKACPACFRIRATFMMAAMPRWGGSREIMGGFASESVALVDENARLAALPGYLHYQECTVLYEAGKSKEALESCTKAIEEGPHWEFLEKRAVIYARMENWPKAREDIDRALKQNPFDRDMLSTAVEARFFGDPKAHSGCVPSAEALLTLARLDPSYKQLGKRMPKHVSCVVKEAQLLARDREIKKARSLCRLARAMLPSGKGQKPCTLIRDKKANIDDIVSNTKEPQPDADDIDGLQAYAARHPGDLKAHQRLDYALARKRRFADVVVVWNGFVKQKPEEGMAYLERAGAYRHMGDLDSAIKDLKRACSLGTEKACALAKRFE